jgi:hypothetical protein
VRTRPTSWLRFSQIVEPQVTSFCDEPVSTPGGYDEQPREPHDPMRRYRGDFSPGCKPPPKGGGLLARLLSLLFSEERSSAMNAGCGVNAMSQLGALGGGPAGRRAG